MTRVYFYKRLANRAPALPEKNLMRSSPPSGHFTSHKVFSPVNRLGFGVWGTPLVQGLGWWGHACVKNLPWVGGEVWAKFGGGWSNSSGVKRGHIGTNSLFYIYRRYQLVIFSYWQANGWKCMTCLGENVDSYYDGLPNVSLSNGWFAFYASFPFPNP